MSYSLPDKTAIDLDILKQRYGHDSLPHHLWYMALDCKRRRDAFWRHYRRMKTYHNLISVPLMIMTSLSGLTSVAQVGSVETDKAVSSPGLPIVISIFSISAAVLTTLQKYFQYSERGEHSKNMAKNYARISKRIENNLVLLESSAVKMEPSMFLRFMEDVQKDTEGLLQQMEELPRELASTKRNAPYENMMKEVKTSRKQIWTSSSPASLQQQPLEDIQEAVMNFTGRGTPESSLDTNAVAQESTLNQVKRMFEDVKNVTDEITKAESRLAIATEEANVADIVNIQLELGKLKESLTAIQKV